MIDQNAFGTFLNMYLCELQGIMGACIAAPRKLMTTSGVKKSDAGLAVSALAELESMQLSSRGLESND
jgi:hypothetical protein